MAYKFETVTEDQANGERFNRVYAVCASCGSLLGRQPGTQDWAAYDHPGTRMDSGNVGDDGQPVYTIMLPRKVALCAPCYGEAFKARYPGEEPPSLHDGRLSAPQQSGKGRR